MTLRHVTDPLRTTAGHGTLSDRLGTTKKTCGAPLAPGRRWSVTRSLTRRVPDGTSLPRRRRPRSSDPRSGHPMTDPQQPTSVYRYYDADTVLIYVGITSRGMQRQHEHNISAEWWPYVARQDVEHYADRPEATERERDLIQRHRPPFNTQHNVDPAAAKAAYLAERERRGAICSCGPDCQRAQDEHYSGWGTGCEAGLKMYPASYADFLADLISRGCDDPHTADLARRFLIAGGMLAVHLGLDTQQAAFIREVLPSQKLIDEHRAQLASQGESEPSA